MANTATAEILSTDSKRGLAMAMMVLSSVVISFGGLIMRNLETAAPWQINFYRAVGLMGAISMILLLRYRSRLFTTIKNIGRIGIIGGALLASAGIMHIQAMTYTSIANAMFVLGAIPFFAALFARLFLGEKLRPVTLWTMCIAATGLSVMVFEGFRTGAVYGNLMAMLTAITFASYAVILRKKRQQEMLPTLLVSSVIIITIAAVATGGDLQASAHDMLLCFAWGAALSGVANYLFIYASRHLAAAETTLFMLLEFALAPLWVWWFISETPGNWTILGGMLIITAVALRALIELIQRSPKQQTVSGPV